MSRIENIVENTPAPPVLTNFRVDMVGFVNPHKMIVRKSSFSVFLSARNGSEWKGESESERLKHKQKGIWIYKKSLNQFPFQRKHQGKKMVVMKFFA
jgi:hypothetical protein